MLTVACVCVPGPGNYDTSHVVRLQRLVENNLRLPFKFFCLTQSDKPGWWAKIDLFRPGLFSGRVLYLDLDVVPVGPLGEVALHWAEFAIWKDPWRERFNSSVMSWEAPAGEAIYNDFDESVMKKYPGDQEWITEKMPNAVAFPSDWVVSYKDHRRRGGIGVPNNARIVACHGEPRPWTARGWLQELWEAA